LENRRGLDEFFRIRLRSRQCKRIEAACVEMWKPFSAEHPAMGVAVPDRHDEVPHLFNTPTLPSTKYGRRSSSG
jgi:hypothetical protein